ncbi:MAG: GNAT family N-acetyltransferase [Eubacterium sp.]|nr:GNAT family N-acetyltransferase [Eubacterium sp.]
MSSRIELNNCKDLFDEEKIYMFTSSPLCILPKKYSKSFSFNEKIKLHLRAIRGYYLYFVEYNEKMIAYCFLKKNYLGKYSFMNKNDLLINPYLVIEEHRGKKLGERILRAALNNAPSNTKNVWAVVLSDNTPSIKTLQKLDFVLAGYSNIKRFSHSLTTKRNDKLVFKINLM